MVYDWAPGKRARNITEHGVDFQSATDFDWSTALVEADARHRYGEVRLTALGLMTDRLHVLVFTIRRNAAWIISFRKANDREVDRYEDKN